MRPKPKVAIWVAQRMSTHGKHPYEYVVERTQNTTDVAVGQILSREKVDDRIASGWTVNVK